MLKRIPPGSDVAVPSAKMFEAAEMDNLLLDFSCHTDVFVTWVVILHFLFVGFSATVKKELRLRLEQAEASLSAARRASEENAEALKKSQDDNEALRIELAEAKTQKEELEAEFATQREELETDYQKQVDEMYFFGYRCCMKKHGIKRDVPSIPPGEEDKLRGKPSQ
ncbi:hypothetical protein CK203_043869 [Vitis vinifera]|uniref:Uncharacterized protein n=1 Tax=Vitis vinifera TaxID=29760 RepID=A0A438HVK6_VITVI|nr:hypothetical protein CK203_043869 [Vitis vinifera]